MRVRTHTEPATSEPAVRLQAAAPWPSRAWPRLVDDLARFVAYPSVSAEPTLRPALIACARWLAGRLSNIGFPDVQLVANGGAPAILGAWQVDPALPTVLLYGHYDVQPPGARHIWSGDPFVLRSVGDRLVGRGASDDKGFVLAQLEAVRRSSLARGRARPPVNLRCIYEGEEEIGSPSLPRVLARHRGWLQADTALICDTEGTVAGRPTLTLSCRGEITVEIDVYGPAGDLHAGRFGGAVHNPAQVLAEAIAALHDGRGRVQLDGFYDRVRPMHPENVDDRAILAAAGVSQSWGEGGYGPTERVTVRPAVVVTSLAAGPPGLGPRHVIPSKATAQVNIRLVADQDPARVYRSVVKHVKRHWSPGAWASTRLLLVAYPWRAQLQHPAVAAAESAVREVTGALPVRVRSGGSIPALSQLEIAGVAPSVVLGFGHAADRAHGPEESVAVRRLELAARTVSSFLARMGEG
jgi:acetylornithine deacetylase/succinyl-diaminopimelate desuccinylase-like protein